MKRYDTFGKPALLLAARTLREGGEPRDAFDLVGFAYKHGAIVPADLGNILTEAQAKTLSRLHRDGVRPDPDRGRELLEASRG